MPACAARGLSLAGEDFGSQGEAKGHVRGVLRGLVGQAQPADHPAFPLLLALLERHPRYEDMVAAPPVQCFRVVPNEMGGSHEVHFADQRGVFVPFSWVKCIECAGGAGARGA